ncbi:MAG: M48 family metallopeptidase [Elusimicrobia bacterium]|nr:M48 family metallopeptidase [Elusimicrobiota bacterium]
MKRTYAASAALLAVISLFGVGCQTVPYTGRSHLLLISASEENALGTQAYQETLRKAKLSGDSEKINLLRRVGHRLAKAADKPNFQWEFNLIEDEKMINAFCLPGGKVAVYTGIWPVMQDEDGLAVVLGHEIAHALARHGAERMSQGMLANFGGQALSVLLANQPARARELYGQAYGLGVGVGILLPYSRAQESEADHIGLILMVKAGYDPHHALKFWERMAKATGEKGENNPLTKYLRTHPVGEERQKNIERWIPEARKYGRRTDTPAP